MKSRRHKMVGACGTYGEGMCVLDFGIKIRTVNLKNLGVDVRDKRVPVTTAWPGLRLRMEERPAIWRVAVNILNKQSQTADKGWSYNMVVGRRVDNRFC
jgi:hypothetical protein